MAKKKVVAEPTEPIPEQPQEVQPEPIQKPPKIYKQLTEKHLNILDQLGQMVEEKQKKNTRKKETAKQGAQKRVQKWSERDEKARKYDELMRQQENEIKERVARIPKPEPKVVSQRDLHKTFFN